MSWHVRRLGQALTLVRRHRRLWPLAFAAALGGTLGETMVLSRSVDFGDPGPAVSFWRGLRATGLVSGQGVAVVWQRWRESPGETLQVIVALVAVGVIGAAVAWVSVVAQGALVHAVALAGAGRPLALSQSWRHGQRKFWPLLGCAIAVKTAVALVFLVLLQFSRSPGIVFSGAFVAGCLVVLWLAVLWKYAAAAVVLQDRGVWPAFLHARRRLAQRGMAGLALMGWLFLLTLGSAALLLVAVFLVSIPFNLLLGTAVLLHFVAGGKLYFYLSWISIVGLVALVALVVTGVHWAAWTLTFVEAETGKLATK